MIVSGRPAPPLGQKGLLVRGTGYMRKIGVCCLGLVLCVGVTSAAEPAGKLVLDNWDVAYIEKSKVGFFHTTVRETEKEGKKYYRTNLEMDLTLKRYADEARLRMENGTEETVDGK